MTSGSETEGSLEVVVRAGALNERCECDPSELMRSFAENTEELRVESLKALCDGLDEDGK